MPEESVAELLRRVRTGDAAAAAELVRRYEPQIRLEVRLRLRDSRLRRVFDSMDICQSVLSSFFLRAAAGEYDAERPENLIGFLIGMARNKLAHEVRRQRAQRRDHRRVEEGGAARLRVIASPGAGPDEQVAGQELLREFRSRLTDEERRLADRRAEGAEWATIATELGGTAEGRRKQLARAVGRVLKQLGLEEGEGEGAG
jgi:RNA polymerase sigma-70 factor (ECF subfamily)